MSETKIANRILGSMKEDISNLPHFAHRRPTACNWRRQRTDSRHKEWTYIDPGTGEVLFIISQVREPSYVLYDKYHRPLSSGGMRILKRLAQVLRKLGMDR